MTSYRRCIQRMYASTSTRKNFLAREQVSVRDVLRVDVDLKRRRRGRGRSRRLAVHAVIIRSSNLQTYM